MVAANSKASAGDDETSSSLSTHSKELCNYKSNELYLRQGKSKRVQSAITYYVNTKYRVYFNLNMDIKLQRDDTYKSLMNRYRSEISKFAKKYSICTCDPEKRPVIYKDNDTTRSGELKLCPVCGYYRDKYWFWIKMYKNIIIKKERIEQLRNSFCKNACGATKVDKQSNRAQGEMLLDMKQVKRLDRIVDKLKFI